MSATVNGERRQRMSEESFRGFIRIPRPNEIAFEGFAFTWEVGHGKSESGDPIVILKLTNPRDDLDFARLGFPPERANALASALTDVSETYGQGSGIAE
jgi:hypothetical protein